jgi:hypothetical protein
MLMAQTNRKHAKDNLCRRTAMWEWDMTAGSTTVTGGCCVRQLVQMSFCYMKLPYWVSHYRRFERSWFLHLQGLRCLRFVLGHGRQHFGGSADRVPSVMSQRKAVLIVIFSVCVLLRVSAILTVMMLNCNSTSSCTTWGSNGSVHQDFISVCFGGLEELLPSSSG